MPLKSYSGPWFPLSKEEETVRDALKGHVQIIAGDIGERHVGKYEEYEACRHYIKEQFANDGFEISEQSYEAGGKTCYNIEATCPGTTRPDEILVVGAHYDSVVDCAGANDNGSAVASMLCMAHAFKDLNPECTLRFVAFANEEAPFFQTELMGSLVYARRCREHGDRIVGMMSYETMGYFSEEPGSQRYPFPLSMFYPNKGNFIGFVGNTKSKTFVKQCIEIFRREVKFPSEGAALPAVLPGVGWSDQWSFWQVDYPALMITDTAPFRYPYYHTAEDTLDKLDYARLARVVKGLEVVTRELGGAR